VTSVGSSATTNHDQLNIFRRFDARSNNPCVPHLGVDAGKVLTGHGVDDLLRSAKNLTCLILLPLSHPTPNRTLRRVRQRRCNDV